MSNSHAGRRLLMCFSGRSFPQEDKAQEAGREACEAGSAEEEEERDARGGSRSRGDIIASARNRVDLERNLVTNPFIF